MAYDQQVLDAIFARANQVDDPTKRSRYLRAALQTGIVESGLRNLDYGDADSLGWRQERKSLYDNPTNIQASVNRFFEEAAQLDHGQKSYELAADVQRPAAQFRGRYHDVASQAAALLKQFGSGSASAPAASGTNPSAGGAEHVASSAPTLTPGQGGDFTGPLAALLGQGQQQQAPQSSSLAPPAFMSKLAQPQGFRPIEGGGAPQQQPASADLSLLETLRGSGTGVTPGEVSTAGDGVSAVRPGVVETVARERADGTRKGVKAITELKGIGTFEGAKVAAWIAPVLNYARRKGWKGQVNSGFRTLEEQTRIFNSGIRPAAHPGTSNHEADEFPGGAVDVSDAEQLSNIIRNSPYAHLLQWAGAKDPVHFSHPHNGSY